MILFLCYYICTYILNIAIHICYHPKNTLLSLFLYIIQCLFLKDDRRKEQVYIYVILKFSFNTFCFSFVSVDSGYILVLYSYSKTALLPLTSFMKFCQIYICMLYI